jgi:SAM-dependent methyltransferase
MNEEPGALWADRSWLTGSQYRTDANLAARQSIYAYQRPRHDIARLAVDVAGLRGGELVADVGCGNGVYLAELARRGHTGPVLGLDLSAGMLRAAAGRAPGAGLAVADATALPLPGGVADVTLAMHMLYHVPEPAAAVRELRRVTRPGGRVLVGLNGDDHLVELRDAVAEVAVAEVMPMLRSHVAGSQERLSLDVGERLLAACFTTVTRHDMIAELVVPGPEPIAGYLRSSQAAHDVADPEDLVTAVLDRLRPAPDGNFHITTHSGCLVCT